jgi:TolB-like protein/DNA-binding winged helix-turn-helix (wHTH) protein/Tfp pilus assembly protein PilF
MGVAHLDWSVMDRRVIYLAREADFALGNLSVHPSTREVSQGGVRSVVEPRVMQVLVALTQADGAVVSKDDLLARCWEGRIVGEDAINRVMSRLRKLSEETGAFRIDTVTRIGHRLVTADIEARRAFDDHPMPAANDDAKPPSSLLRRRAVVVGGAALAAATATGVWTAVRPTPALAAKSVAVVPFRALDGESEKYFSEGFSQEISVELASMPGMKVIAPTSVSLAADKNTGSGEIAKLLDVNLLLSGSVQRQADQLRITCELVDARTSYTIWADTFDRKAQDIFDIQREIARQVGGIVSVQAAPAATAKTSDRDARSGGTRNVEAYDAFLKGTNLLERGLGEAGDRAAAAEFERALALDPKFARAHAELAMAYASIGMYSSPTPALVAANLAKALRIAQEAVALAPDLPIANTRLAYILVAARYDFVSATRYIERALQFGPGIAIVQASYAGIASLIGRVNPANAAIARAIELDPLNPSRRRIAAQISLLNHDYEQAVKRAADALALDQRGSLVNGYMGDALVMLGRFQEARDAYNVEPVETVSWTGLAIASFHLGEHDAAHEWHGKLASKYGESSSYQYAQIWAQWGEFGKAIEALNSAWRVLDTGLTLILRDPLLLPLNDQPAFRAIVSRMRFV